MKVGGWSLGSVSYDVILGNLYANPTPTAFTATNQLLLKSGANSNTETIIFRNDGANFYLLLSNKTTNINQSFNGLRPFYINLVNGLLHSDNGQRFSGGAIINNGATINGNLVLGNPATNTSHAVRADRVISTGSGLSGGGNLSANRELSVDNTVMRTTGNQIKSGWIDFVAGASSSNIGPILTKDGTSWLIDCTGGSAGDLKFWIGSAAVNSDGTVYTGPPGTYSRWVNRFTFNSLGRGTSPLGFGIDSDYRLKKNITPLINGKEKIKNLNPVNYELIDNPNVKLSGFIAHELQKIIPNAVFGTKDELDKDGKPNYQSVSSDVIVAELTSALKEVIFENEELKSKICILEEKIQMCLDKLDI
jgi:hypothetical protein